MIYRWNIFVVESMHGLVSAFSLGEMYKQSQAFLAWAASYDEGGLDIRSRRLHDQWLSTLPCSILYFEGEYSIREHLAV